MSKTAYNITLKGYVGGEDFDRNTVDRTLADNEGKQVNVLIDSLGGSLATLDVSKNTQLTLLNCYHNQLTALDVSKNTQLTLLNCYHNHLTTLDVSKSAELTDLHCDYNELTVLDVSKSTKLTRLACDYNPGLNNVFTVYAWFDNSSIPSSYGIYFTHGSWGYNGSVVRINYVKVN